MLSTDKRMEQYLAEAQKSDELAAMAASSEAREQ